MNPIGSGTIPRDGCAPSDKRVLVMLPLILLVASSLASSAAAQAADHAPSLFGISLCSVSDLDGDGVGDLAVGDPRVEGWTGQVSYVSGRSGALLSELVGDRRGAGFGTALVSSAAPGPMGRWAVLARTMGEAGSFVDVFEGAPPRRVLRLETREGDRAVGVALAGVGSDSVLVVVSRSADLEGGFQMRCWSLPEGEPLWSRELGGQANGPAPWLFREPHRKDGGAGAVLVHGTNPDGRLAFLRLDSRTGDLLSVANPPRGYDQPLSIAALELDGDAFSDFVLGQPGDSDAAAGQAIVVAGANSRILRRHVDSSRGLGSNVAALGDLNRDGADDYAVATYDVLDRGRVRVHSGASGDVMHTWESADTERDVWHRFGIEILGIHDLDGDGVRDVAVGSTNPFAPTGGSVRAYSGRGGGLLWSVER